MVCKMMYTLYMLTITIAFLLWLVPPFQLAEVRSKPHINEKSREIVEAAWGAAVGANRGAKKKKPPLHERAKVMRDLSTHVFLSV